MLQTIWFKGKEYPSFQADGGASRWVMPLALEICKGTGYDIGYSREEWKLPHAIGVDPAVNPEYNAMNLPAMKVDFIFSSHCLEHVDRWADALDYWASKLHAGGVIFLYLPDFSQEYWRPYNNRKHIHSFTPNVIEDYLNNCGLFHKVFVSGVDANNSFTAFAEKI